MNKNRLVDSILVCLISFLPNVVFLTSSAAQNYFGSVDEKWLWEGDTALYCFSPSQISLCDVGATASAAEVAARVEQLNTLNEWSFSVAVPRDISLTSRNNLEFSLLSSSSEKLFSLRLTGLDGVEYAECAGHSAPLVFSETDGYRIKHLRLQFVGGTDGRPSFTLSVSDAVDGHFTQILHGDLSVSFGWLSAVGIRCRYSKTRASNTFFVGNMRIGRSGVPWEDVGQDNLPKPPKENDAGETVYEDSDPAVSSVSDVIIPHGSETLAPTAARFICRASRRDTKLSMRIYSTSGYLLASPYSAVDIGVGSQTLEWRGTDSGGAVLPPATYIVHFLFWDATGRECSRVALITIAEE